MDLDLKSDSDKLILRSKEVNLTSDCVAFDETPDVSESRVSIPNRLVHAKQLETSENMQVQSEKVRATTSERLKLYEKCLPSFDPKRCARNLVLGCRFKEVRIGVTR